VSLCRSHISWYYSNCMNKNPFNWIRVPIINALTFAVTCNISRLSLHISLLYPTNCHLKYLIAYRLSLAESGSATSTWCRYKPALITGWRAEEHNYELFLFFRCLLFLFFRCLFVMSWYSSGCTVGFFFWSVVVAYLVQCIDCCYILFPS